MRYKGKKLNESTNAKTVNNFNKYIDDTEPTFDATRKRNSEDLNMQPLNIGIRSDFESNEKVEL